MLVDPTSRTKDLSPSISEHSYPGRLYSLQGNARERTGAPGALEPSSVQAKSTSI